MNIFSSRFINTISLFISIIVFFIINESLNVLFKDYSKTNFLDNTVESKIKSVLIENSKENEILNWYIQIPSINLKAPIEEGTGSEILNKSVGHFTETPFTFGNIGLTAHNRGYEKNYFENLKKIKIGSEIFYKKDKFEKRYIVKIIKKIKDTNWDYLEETKENKITLITCIENEPNFRLCIQAIES